MTTLDDRPAARADEVRAKNRKHSREETASRLLASSAKLSFDPNTEVEWDAEPVEGLWFMQPEAQTLYGTDLWRSLSFAQQNELCRHQLAAIASNGAWFEMVLMRMLVRHLNKHPLDTNHVRYGLTEIADECRHSVMFSRLVEWLGTGAYGPPPLISSASEIMTTPLVNDAIALAGTYYVEAILDAIQRVGMNDERCQPVTRKVAYIHVVEEARHMRYADEELARLLEDMSFVDRQRTRILTAVVAQAISYLLMHPKGYAAAGLDVRTAEKVAASNPSWIATKKEIARKPVKLFTELGLMRGPAMEIWKRSGAI